MEYLLPTGKVITKEEFLVMGTKDYRSMIFDIYVKTGLFVEQKNDSQAGHIPPLQQAGGEQDKTGGHKSNGQLVHLIKLAETECGFDISEADMTSVTPHLDQTSCPGCLAIIAAARPAE